MFEFRIHESIISEFIGPAFEAIYNGFAPEFMKIPTVSKNDKTWSKVVNWDYHSQAVFM